MLRTVGALTAIGLAAIVGPVTAADVTPERLLNSTSDPQNWLMVHRDYDNSRHSGLKEINNTNAKDLKLKFMISIGGRATGGTLRGKEEATPLVDDGFMYVNDTWGRVMKFDVRSGTVSGVLNGTVGLTKTTSGTVTLSGANAFTGGVTLNGGSATGNW